MFIELTIDRNSDGQTFAPPRAVTYNLAYVACFYPSKHGGTWIDCSGALDHTPRSYAEVSALVMGGGTPIFSYEIEGE